MRRTGGRLRHHGEVGEDGDEADTDSHDERAVTAAPTPDRHWASHVDTAGAVLLVIGCLGTAAWAWTLIRQQFDVGGESPFSFGGDGASASDRIDMFANQVPVLLFAGLVGGLGVALRAAAWANSPEDRPAERSVFGRPFGRLLLGSAAALALLLVMAVLLDNDDDRDGFDFGRAGNDIARELDSEDEIVATTTASPPEPTHTLEVHTDGCGVIRSGEIGEDLTWVVKDQDGFQVLGRNAAGEIAVPLLPTRHVHRRPRELERRLLRRGEQRGHHHLLSGFSADGP